MCCYSRMVCEGWVGGGYFTMKNDAIMDNSLPRIRVGNISTPIITSSQQRQQQQ